MEFLRKNAWPCLGIILFGFFALSLLVSSQESTTMDEKAHIPSAYSYVRFGDMRLNPEHPPLLKDLAGLPLLFLNVKFPLVSQEWQRGINEQWVLGDKFINCADPVTICNDADAITFWSRVPIIIVALLLGIALFVWTKELGGTLAGLFAVVLYAFDPNIIGHSHYVTTDIGIAAFLFFAFYFFVRFLRQPSGKNVFWAGIFLGLAQLAKFSAVLLFPIFGLFVLLYALTKRRSGNETSSALTSKLRMLVAYSVKFAGIVGICFALIWILYFFNTLTMPGEKLTEIARAVFPDTGLGPMAKNFVITTSNHPLLKPFSEYFLGVFMVFARVAGGNTYYFLGTVSNHASPWYFPVVFLLKETLPFLLLLVCTAAYTFFRAGKFLVRQRLSSLPAVFSDSFQHRITQYAAMFFVLFYSYISITGNLNIGFRHLFPILPFLYMLVSKTAFDILKRHQDEIATHQLLRIGIGGIVLIIMSIPLLSYPGYLSYFNAVGGGHTNGYRYVTDSNYDWGQDLKRLQGFVENFNACKTGQSPSSGLDICERAKQYPAIDKIRVDYFGGSNPEYYLQEKFIPWHGENAPAPGWYAISIGFFQESTHKTLRPGEYSYRWLDAYAPVARAGDSIFIYYVPEIK